jgi:hypothetical protein
MKNSTTVVLFLALTPLMSLADVTLKNSRCENSVETVGAFIKVQSTCECQGKKDTGEFKGRNFNLAKSTAEARARAKLAAQFSGNVEIDCNETSNPSVKVEEKKELTLPTLKPTSKETKTSSASSEIDFNRRIRDLCPNGIRESKQNDGRTYLFCNNSKDNSGPLRDESGNFIIQGEKGLETFNRSGKDQKEEPKIALPQESPKKEIPIIELIRSCKEPNLDKEACRELTEINPKFAEMMNQLNEKYRNRNALRPEGVDANQLAKRENYELALRLLDLEYQDDKKIYDSFCENNEKTALCLTDIDRNNLENNQKMEKCLIQRLSNIQMKNPKAQKEKNSVFAMKHIELWQKSGSDCNKIIAQDEKTYQLEKFYNTNSKIKDFDPSTCEWFLDLPRRIVRGAMKSCTNSQRAEACVGYVVCKNKEDGSKFIRQSTCSKDNCTNDRAIACTVEKNYSSADYVLKKKDQDKSTNSGVQKE